MAADYVIGIGTVGAGLWLGYRAGQSWRHVPNGPPVEASCRAVVVHPHRPEELWAAVDRVGLFRSDDRGATWSQVGPRIDADIWSIGLDPTDDRRIFLGTCPGVWRSRDGGTSFEELTTSISADCPIGTSRTTNVVVDAAAPGVVWASVEVDGLHRSDDGGDTWTSLGALGAGPFYDDVHGFDIVATPSGRDLLVTTPFGLGRSIDEGETFDWHEFAAFAGSKLPVAYSRCVRALWDDVVVVCVGDNVPGRIGALEISRDGGRTWQREDLPVTPNSTMYWLATHPDLPGTIVATSLFGQVFVSEDHATTWRKLEREFGEIRGVALTPAA